MTVDKLCHPNYTGNAVTEYVVKRTIIKSTQTSPLKVWRSSPSIKIIFKALSLGGCCFDLKCAIFRCVVVNPWKSIASVFFTLDECHRILLMMVPCDVRWSLYVSKQHAITRSHFRSGPWRHLTSPGNKGLISKRISLQAYHKSHTNLTNGMAIVLSRVDSSFCFHDCITKSLQNITAMNHCSAENWITLRNSKYNFRISVFHVHWAIYRYTKCTKISQHLWCVMHING